VSAMTAHMAARNGRNTFTFAIISLAIKIVFALGKGITCGGTEFSCWEKRTRKVGRTMAEFLLT
jgi:hypothetical protein